RAPDGPGASGALTSWASNPYTFTTGPYSISLSGASFAVSPPANDLCANAITLSTYGAMPYSNVGAGNDGPTACGSLRSDIWFKHTACTCGTITADTCAANSYDSALAVYTGSCSGLALVSCNDDTAGCGAFGTSSRVTWTASL